jgi:hypothetical protein
MNASNVIVAISDICFVEFENIIVAGGFPAVV